MSGKVFSGNIYVAPVDVNGVMTGGLIGPLNTQKLELVTPAPTLIDQVSKQNGTVGQLLSQAAVPKATSLNTEFDDTGDQRVLAFALNGIVNAYSQAGGSIVAEVVQGRALGDWVPLANIHVSAVVVKDSAAAITYTAGTDYLVDAKAGLVKPLAGGTITPNESLKISYTAAAVTGSDVQGSLVASNLLRVQGNLINLVDGTESRFVCPIYHASSSGNNDLLGQKMLVAGLGGAMFVPPVGTAAATETGGAPYLLRAIAAS